MSNETLEADAMYVYLGEHNPHWTRSLEDWEEFLNEHIPE